MRGSTTSPLLRVVVIALLLLAQQGVICSSYRKSDESGASSPFPVLLSWHAPLLSHSGYGQEALEYLNGLDEMLLKRLASPSRRQPAALHELSGIAAEPHGDTVNPAVLAGLPLARRRLLRHHLQVGHFIHQYGVSSTLDAIAATRQDQSHQRSDPASTTTPVGLSVAVCHSEPGAWSVPRPLYSTSPCPPWYAHVAIARTMFETDRIPSGWVPRLQEMDDIWVPSNFHVETFSRSGVDVEKLFVVGESLESTGPMGWHRGRCDGPPLRQDKVSPVERFFEHVLHRPEILSDCDVIFLSVFKWEYRKGWDVLVEAFAEEFLDAFDTERRLAELTAEDAAQQRVCLVIKTSAYHDDDSSTAYMNKITHHLTDVSLKRSSRPPLFLGLDSSVGNDEAVDALLRSLPKDPERLRSARRLWGSGRLRVHIITEPIDDVHFPLLFCAATALVQPSRGEGWGRPHMEAMAMEVPVIATNWSGTTAFLTDETGFPIAVGDELETIADGPFAGHRWARPQKDHLRQHLRFLAKHGPRGFGSNRTLTITNPIVASKVKLAREAVETSMSNAAIAAQMWSRIEWLLARNDASGHITWRERLIQRHGGSWVTNAAPEDEEEDDDEL